MIWDEAFDVMAAQCQAGAEGKGPTARRHVRLRPVDDLRRLCRHQADAGRLPLQQSRSQCPPLHGVGGRTPSCAPSAWTSRWAATTISRHADAFVLWGSNMAEMHPILWTRVADRRLGHPHVKVAVLSTFTHRSMRPRRHPDGLQAGHGSGDPELHRQPHHPRPGASTRTSSRTTRRS